MTLDAERRSRRAAEAGIHPLIAVEDRSGDFRCEPIGNAWTRHYYGGPFHLFDAPADRPAISIVFVQSRDGNTGADNPADLGGGDTDLHLIYEGVTRVAADAVMAGATTIGRDVVFSVWHPEIVRLRAELGLPRHPVQVVVSNEGRLDLEASIFTTPELRVVLVGGPKCRTCHAQALAQRPWITLLPTEGGDLTEPMKRLRRDFGIGRISLVGGRRLATSVVDAGLALDLCLTTSAISAGEPDTPWYVGRARLATKTIVRKRESGTDLPIRFEHLALV